MNVVHVSTSDTRYGGFIAARRLHAGMRALGADSQLVVQYKAGDDPHVVAAQAATRLGRGTTSLLAVLDGLPLQLYKKSEPMDFSAHWLPTGLPPKLRSMHPDIVNLHWISGGFLSVESLPAIPAPLVWTLHDFWAFTGGCHYSHGCQAYDQSCGACPELGSRSRHDLSWIMWQRKARAWSRLDLTLVAPSAWVAECAKSSRLLRDRSIHVIPNGLDVQRFAPVEQSLARRMLQLPMEKKIILFGAPDLGNKRKGFDLLEAAVLKLANAGMAANLQLVVFGAASGKVANRFGLDTRYLGRLHDELTLAIAYSAADVMVVPSREETFGQTASEALACGTPVVCFDATGLRDVVDHLDTGYRAQSFEVDDLARGIVWVLEDEERRQEMGRRARRRAEQAFTIEQQARSYLKVYSDILDRSIGIHA